MACEEESRVDMANEEMCVKEEMKSIDNGIEHDTLNKESKQDENYKSSK